MVNAHETLDDLLGFMAWGTEGSAAHGACNTNDMLGSHRSTNWQGSTGLQNRGLAVDNDDRLRPAAATMGHTARACDAHINLDNLCKSMAWGAEVCNTHERHGFITFSWSTEASACAQEVSAVNETLDTLRSRVVWQRANLSSGGLLDWAMVEIHDRGDDYEVLRLESTAAAGPGQPAQQATVRPRSRLTHEEAVAIFLAKLGPKVGRTASLLAAEFRITPKAVRDIWTMKTWSEHTRRLMTMPTNETDCYLPFGTPSPTAVAAASRVHRALQPSPPPSHLRG